MAKAIGKVVSIARYPVKSMAGEHLSNVRLTPHGIEHDRLYAFESTGAPAGMLRLTARERRQMLQHSASVDRHGQVWVSTGIDEPRLVNTPEMLNSLQSALGEANRLVLTVTTTPQTDVRPLSLLSVQTVEALSSEIGQALDLRRFRSNLVLDLDDGAFAEDRLVGRTLAIGTEAEVVVRERTPRCRFVAYDPASPIASDPLFSLMKLLDHKHQGRVGVYASVLKPGEISLDDVLRVID